MNPTPTHVGIDVSQSRLDIAVRPAAARFSFANDDPGVAETVSCLQALQPALVVLEATGGYELPLVGELVGAGLPVVMVNPRQVRDFARATGRLAKTDAIDASVLAQFAEAVQPPVRPLPDAATQELRGLLMRRQQLIEMLVAEKNRQRQAGRRVKPQIDAHINWLAARLDELDKELGDF